MALLAFYGFDHCKSAVGSDGVSPVNGVGPDSWGYSGLTVSGGTDSNPMGVSSATSLLMGKAPKRKALTAIAGLSQSAALIAVIAPMNGKSTTGYTFGFRFRATASSDGTVVAAQCVIRASKDPAYAGAGAITPTANGVAAAATALTGNSAATTQLSAISDLSSGIPLTEYSANITAAGA